MDPKEPPKNQFGKDGPFGKFLRGRKKIGNVRAHAVGLISLVSCTVFAVFLTVHVPAMPKVEQNIPYTLQRILALLRIGHQDTGATLKETSAANPDLDPENLEIERELEAFSRRIKLKQAQTPPQPLDSVGPYQGLPPLPPPSSSSSSSSL